MESRNIFWGEFQRNNAENNISILNFRGKCLQHVTSINRNYAMKLIFNKRTAHSYKSLDLNI